MPDPSLDPLFSAGCERCGREGPWMMYVDEQGVTSALCGECVEALTDMTDEP